MRIKTVRIGSLAVACFVVLGLSSFQVTNCVYGMKASDFTDVNINYWGYPYIDFSADNGIINGYQSFDGSYRFLPENSVSKEESMAMLYRALSAAGKLKSGEDNTGDFTDLFTENKIAGWAQKFVAYGLKYGLITTDELADFTDENGLRIPAPREQVALWTARAMGRNLAPAFSLVYVDKDSISSENLPYVDLLYRYGIMQGDNTKTFHPSSGIKRAEFAAICNRVFETEKANAYSEDKEVQSYRGTLVSVDTYSNIIMMTMSGGIGKVIQINPKTQIVIDGKVNYNGIGGIATGATAVVAWGAFCNMDQSNSDENILQLHIITKIQTRTGILSDIIKLDDQTSLLKISNNDGNLIYYILDKESRTEQTPVKGAEITFIADGIKILELK